MTHNDIVNLIVDELYNANNSYSGFHSTHEGFAVLKEEVDELWDEIKISKNIYANRLMVNEAVQVAAMAIKFIENLYHNEEGLEEELYE